MSDSVHEKEPSIGGQGILDALAAPVFALDRDLRYTAFNAAHADVMRRAYGVEIELGGHALEYRAIPLDGELAKSTLERSLNGEIVVTREWVGPKKDRFFVTTHSPIREARRMVGVVMVLLDLTNEERAAEADAHLAAIVASSDDSIVSTSLDGVILTWNPGAERMYGYSPQEAIGRSLDFLFTSEEAERVRQILGGVAQGEAVAHFESTRQRKDGTRVDVSVGVTPLWRRDGVIIGASSISHDITRRNLAEEEIRKTARALKAISLVNETLVRAQTQEDLLSVCDTIVHEAGYAVAWVASARNDDAKSMVARQASGVDADELNALRLTCAEGPDEAPAGRAIRECKAFVIQDTKRGSGFEIWRAFAISKGIRSSLSLPLARPGGSILGALTIGSVEPDAFDAEAGSLLDQMANDIAYGMESLETRERLFALLHEVTETMGAVVEARDPYTHGHQVRVAALTRLIAEEMGLPRGDVDAAEMAALVHDIGKLSVPAEILTKPGKLSDAEFALVKAHPRAGYDILKHIHFGSPVADAVLQHHERMDGSGYPKGIAGDDILVAARILAMADVVEAMSSHRPYRAALGVDAAVVEIRNHPERFDPAVTAACVRLYEAGRIVL